MGERREGNPLAAGEEGRKQKVMEQVADTITSLNDDLLNAVIEDVCNRDDDAAIQLLRNCPMGMTRIIGGIFERLQKGKKLADVAMAVSVAFEIGWRACEAVRECQALERMNHENPHCR
ncbi:MAG TPA: hypothetical protein VFC10_07295 [Terriglobia bacterium]|nr:hypothetical protein [Terriglobia bacterium]